MPFSWKGRADVIIPAVLVFCHLILISIQIPKGSEQTFFQRAIFSVFSPVQRVAGSVFRSTAEAWKGFFNLRDVRSENQQLKKEIFFLRQENGILQGLSGFLEGEKRLKENMSVIRKSFVPARVIGHDPSNYYRSIVINRGRLAGVRTNMAVCDQYGNLIGRVTDPVTARESRVQLVTDGDSGVSVISAGRDKIVGVLSGESQGMCRMKYVRATASGGAEGDELITTGFDKIYPPGLRVGAIVGIGQDASLFKVVSVRPYFSFTDLGVVAVINEKFQELF